MDDTARDFEGNRQIGSACTLFRNGNCGRNSRSTWFVHCGINLRKYEVH